MRLTSRVGGVGEKEGKKVMMSEAWAGAKGQTLTASKFGLEPSPSPQMQQALYDGGSGGRVGRTQVT